MSDSELEVGSLEYKMNAAVLNMNRTLRQEGFNERERAKLWGMTVSELRVFLTDVWEAQNNAKKEDDELTAQIDRLHGAGASAVLDAAIADGSIFNDNEKEGADEHSEADGPGKKGSDLPAPDRSGDSDDSAGAIRTKS